MREFHEQGIRDQASLRTHLEHMLQANQRLSAEANGLATALKGSTKSQGDWGEIVLERILETSGLREGEEYVRQGVGLNLTDSEGRKQKPDIIVRIPGNKHVVVDSKVTVNAFVKLVNASSEAERQTAEAEYFACIRQHVAGLSEKKYDHNQSLGTPEYVLLFIPTEASYSHLVRAGLPLVEDAWAKGVIIVGPTNLLTCLKTISSVWKQERQNKNVQAIVEQGGKLYDKFVGFVTDLVDIGTSIDGAKKSWEGAFNKLKDGRGNLVNQAEKLRSLGAKTKKELPRGLVSSDADDEAA